MKDTIQSEPSKPFTWLSPVALILAVVGGCIIYSVYQYSQAARIMSLFYVDVSDSIQPYKQDVAKICEATKDLLMDGDIRVEAKFAERVFVTSNTDHEGKQVTGDCQAVTLKPEGVGKYPGTDITAALSSMITELKHQRSQGNKQRVAATLVIQAAEPKTGQKPTNLKVVKELVQKIAKEGYLSIIGPDVILQGDLSQELTGVANVKICTFTQAQDCGINWAFNQVRK
jgi:hypothetical protein